MKKFTLPILMLIGGLAFGQVALSSMGESNPVYFEKTQNTQFILTSPSDMLSEIEAELLQQSLIQQKGLPEQPTINIEELLTKLSNIGNNSGSIDDYFTPAEQRALNAHFGNENIAPQSDIIPTAGATETFNASVGDHFFDPGGPGGSSTGGTAGNYPNCGCDTFTTLTGVTEIEFQFFSVFATFDWLKIYDGIDATGPILYNNASGGANAGDIDLADMIASHGSATFTGTSGNFYFIFHASTVVDYGGWDAEIMAGGGGGNACSQSVPSNAFENGLGDITTGVEVADDFVVADGDNFTANQLTVNIMHNGGFNDLIVGIFEDAGGLPGTQVGGYQTIVPTSSTIIGTAFGFNVNEIVLDLTPVVLNGTVGSETVYWVTIEGPNPIVAGAGYWETTTVAGSDNPVANDVANGGWGVNGFGFQSAIFEISGDCTGGGGGGTVCGSQFFDSGGAGGNYQNNENITTVLMPDNAGEIINVTFTAFDVEVGWDALYVYDGPDATYPIIDSGNPPTNGGFPAGGYYGTTNPGPFVSSDPSGALTFVFMSDGSVPKAGWVSDVTCTGGGPTVCGSQFFDTGGAGGNYQNNENVTTVLMPDNAGEIINVTFTAFDVEVGWDALYVYDGPDATYPIIDSGNPPTNGGFPAGGYYGTTNPGPFVSSDPSGALTFVFMSDGSVPKAGWEADVTCSGGGGGGNPVAYCIRNSSFEFATFDPADASTVTAIAPSPAPGFENVGAIDPNNLSTGYALDNLGNFYSIDVATGNYTSLGTIPGDWTGGDFDPTTGIFYAMTTTNLYSIDIAGVTATNIGSLGMPGGALPIALAIDGSGNGYTYDLVDDSLYSVDLATGATAIIGPIGFDANFGQGMAWDPTSDTVYMTAFNNAIFDSEFRSVNTATGMTTLLTQMEPGTLTQYAWVSFGETQPPADCPEPTNLTVTNITETTADLAWDIEPNATNGYVWYVFLAGDDPATDTPVDTGATPAGTTTATADGLTNATSYDFYVVADCAADGLSFYAGPVPFETLITPPQCGGHFYDTGGPSGPYENNANVTTTILPDVSGDVVTVTFTAFEVETGWDALYVYDGPDSSFPIFDSGNPPTNTGFPAGGYYGTTNPGPFTSTHSSGALTFVFLSDGSVVQAGWESDVTCAGVPPPNDEIVNSIDVDEIGFPYTDPNVAMQAATTEDGTPSGCDITGANGVWYNFVPEGDGTANATIITPAGTSSVTFYTAPDEDAIETDLALVVQNSNQCAPGTTASINTVAGQAYYVFVLNTGGPTDIVIDGTNLGVEDNTIEGFSYYPNPTREVINLQSVENIETVAIYNVLGQKIIDLNVNATTSQINVSALSTGTYIMKVSVNGQIGTYKVLKK